MIIIYFREDWLEGFLDGIIFEDVCDVLFIYLMY